MITKSLDLTKSFFFILLIIGLAFLYYKKVLSVNNDGNKLLKGLKHLFAVLVLLGLLSLFSTIKSVTGQFVLLIFIAVIINLYNINHSINKCNFPTIFKVNLFGRSSVIIIFIALLLYYSYEGNIFRFLYSDVKLDSGNKAFTVLDLKNKLDIKVKMPAYCPDMDNDDYKDNPLSDENKKWKKLSDEQRKQCSAKRSEKSERDDIDSGVYA